MEITALTKDSQTGVGGRLCKAAATLRHVFKPENAHQLEQLQAIADRNIKRFHDLVYRERHLS